MIILATITVGLYLAGQLWEIAVHFSDIIALFFLGWLLAFILQAVVRFLQARLFMSRALATAVVYVVLLFALISVVILVVPLLLAEAIQLATQLPGLSAQVPGFLASVLNTLSEHDISVDFGAIAGPSVAQRATEIGSSIVANSVIIASSIASGVLSFVILLIISFYLVLDGQRFLDDALNAIPRRFEDDARAAVDSVYRSFGGFLRGTAVMAGFLGLGTGVIMTVAGLPYVLLASLVAAVVMIIPFLGPVLAMVLPILIAVFNGMSSTQVLVLLLAFVVLQILVMNVLSPKIMADSVGLHPLLVFLALLVGAKQAGIAGALFGVPAAAVLWSVVRILIQRWTPPVAVIQPIDAMRDGASDLGGNRNRSQSRAVGSRFLLWTMSHVFKSRAQ